MGYESRFKRERPKAEALYKNIRVVRCPYFNADVSFTSDGFHHLRYNVSGSERRKQTQLLKFSLIGDAERILRVAGTVQEYRKQWGVVGRKKARDGSQEMKEIEYWGFVALVNGRENGLIRVRVILRKVGNGQLHFWSVMPHSRLKRKDTYKLASETIFDE